MYAIITSINKGNQNSPSFGKEYLRLKGHSKDITSIRYSPCGSYLATGSCDRIILIYGVIEGKKNFGKVITSLIGHTDSILSIEYSPIGNLLASGGNDCCGIVYKLDNLVYDINANVEQFKLDGHSNTIYSVCFSECGCFLATGSADRSANIYCTDPQNSLNFCKQIYKINTNHKDWILNIAFCPNFRFNNTTNDSHIQYLATGSADKKTNIYKFNNFDNIYNLLNDSIELYDFKKESVSEMILSLDSHKDRISFVEYSPCSYFFATASDDKSVIIYC